MAEGARILVIDDDQSMLRLIRANLSAAGYTVATAGTGEEGLQLAETFHPRVVILDLLLPGMDGFAVCRKFRENPAYADTAILMATAVYLSEEDARRGFTTGADQFLVKPDVILSKPVHLRDLRATVERLLAGPTPSEPAHEAAPKERVLLVDDDDKNLRLLRMRFASEGFEVQEALSGQAALELEESFAPQVVLMDLKMPTMSGLDVLKVLRERGRDVPVVIMTAHGSESVAVEAFKGGAADYLIKPIDSALAVRMAAQIIERYRLRRSQEQLTERLKKISCDLVNRVNHLEQQNRKLEEAYTAVRGLSEFNRRFIRSLSQELRAPLSTILSFLSLLRDTPPEHRDPVRERESLEIVFKTAFRLEVNLSNLLYLSRIQAGALTTAAGTLELEPAVEGVLHLARRSLGREGFGITWFPESRRHRVVGDAALMRDILVNLLDNAQLRTEGGGEVTVEVLVPEEAAGPGPRRVHLRLRDNGSRHPDEDLAAWPVTELAPESVRQGAEAVRLNLSRHLAEVQGWRLSVTNRPQGGGEAVLEIPAHGE